MGSYRLTWRPLLNGHIALGHKPGKRLRAQLDAAGCTLVVNLLGARESRARASASRIRLPLAGAEPPGPERAPEVLACFAAMTDALAAGGKVYVHCSAGLHRTGMIAYAYFRHLGDAREQAVARIAALREQTAAELREARMAWGDQLAPGPGAGEPTAG